MNSDNDFGGFVQNSLTRVASNLKTAICDLTSDANMLSDSQSTDEVEIVKQKPSTSKAAMEQRKSENLGEKSKKPFELGRKSEPIQDQSRLTGEVSCHIPRGKKAKGHNGNLKNDLNIECFTIIDEPIDDGKDVEFIPERKTNRRKRGRDTLTSTSYDRIQDGNNSEDNPEVENDRNVSNEIKKKTKSSVIKDKKLVKPCSIRCKKASNIVPTLQCQTCLCLYHSQCVELPAFYSLSNNNYVCKNCIDEQSNKEEEEHTKNVQLMSNEGGSISNVLNPEHAKQCLIQIGDKRFVYVPKNVQQSKIKNIDPGFEVVSKKTVRPKTTAKRNLVKKMRSEKAPEEWFNRANTVDVVLDHVFNYLSTTDLKNASQVCKMWNSIAKIKLFEKNAVSVIKTEIDLSD